MGILELMFVIDATASMDPYIRGVKRVITSISQSIQNKREVNTRIGILCYRDYIQNQYIYHELVIEDTPIPSDIRKHIKLFNYRPIHENKKYFLRKAPMVRKFVCYLEKVEKLWLNRAGIDVWLDGFKIFPALKQSLQKQEKLIASALNLKISDISGSW